MQRFPSRWLGLLVAAWLCGCGSSHETLCEQTRRYAEVMSEQIKVFEELVEVLTSIQTPADMNGAKERLRERLDNVEKLAQRARSMPPPSQAVKDKIQEQLGPQVSAVFRRLKDERQRIEKLPGGTELIKDLGMLKKSGQLPPDGE
jgi:predicted RNase H-like nuclease (RuvC/YqgF family)